MSGFRRPSPQLLTSDEVLQPSCPEIPAEYFSGPQLVFTRWRTTSARMSQRSERFSSCAGRLGRGDDVAGSNELTEFVREALAGGKSRAEVEEVLLRAGWIRDVVQTALAGYADVEFSIPVPKPKSYLSAREAFLYLLLFTTLWISAYNLGVLVFQFINQAFPDAAVRTFETWARQEVRWALSSLIVSFPVFVYLSGLTGRSVRRDPGKRRSNVRRWLMYVTVFVAASVLIGDFITLVYNALGGELSIRFVLKVLTIATIAATVFGYYLSDLRLEDTKSPVEGTGWKRTIAGFAAVSVTAAVVAGLFVIGSPAEERARRLDERRVENLQMIQRSVYVYFDRHGRLPSSLEELSREDGMRIDQLDPLGGPYEFRLIGAETYELCATFQRGSAEDGGARSGEFWSHEAGRRCFQLKAKEPRS